MKRLLCGSILILLGGPLAANRTLAAQMGLNDPTLAIAVKNYALVDPATLDKAEAAATAIFRKAGVRAQWVDPPFTPAGQVSISRDLPTFGVQVHILPAEMAGRLNYPKNVTGLAPGAELDRQIVYVFYDRIEALGQRQNTARVEGKVTRYASKPQLLGAIISHEIGHVLLNLRSHPTTGIMHNDWNLKDLADVSVGCLLFTRPQAEVIRAEVARRLERETVEAAEQRSPR